MNNITYNKTNKSPNKVICIGRNYVEHAKELGNEVPTQMVIFFKPNSSISDEICFFDDETCHYESELSFLINANKLTAVSFGLDLTKRDIQSTLKAKGLPWERAKSFRGSAVFSEFVDFEVLEDLQLELFINDKLVQQASVDLMINKPYEILKEVQTFCDIEDNDILMSGTPKGVGKLTKNDVLVAKIFEKDRLLISKTWQVKA